MSAAPGSDPAGQKPPTGPPTTPSQPPSVPPQSVPAGAARPTTTQYVAKTPWTAYIKPVCWTLVAIYVVLFVFLNRDTVVINFVFFSASVPLIYVLLGLTLIGGILGAGVMVRTRRRAQRRAELDAARAASQKSNKK